MIQTREKWDFLFGVELTFQWYAGAMVFPVFIFIFLFRANGYKRTLRWEHFPSLVIFSKVPFWKLVDHSYVQSSFSTIFNRHMTKAFERHFTVVSTYVKIDHGLRYVQNKLSTKLFLGSTSWNENLRSCLENIHLQKNPSLYFEEHCTEKDSISLIVVCFFSCKQT